MKVILIGFESIEIEGIKILLQDLAQVVVPSFDDANLKVKEVVDISPEYSSSDWCSSKIVIIHEGEGYIKEIMSRIRSLNLGRIIFATTTPTSLEWKLNDLIQELKEEDEYFKRLERK